MIWREPEYYYVSFKYSVYQTGKVPLKLVPENFELYTVTSMGEKAFILGFTNQIASEAPNQPWLSSSLKPWKQGL